MTDSHWRRLLVLCSILALIGYAPLRAATRDVITGQAASTEPLSIAPPPKGSGAAQLVYETVKADLERSHRFTFIEYDGPIVTKPAMASGLIVPRGATYLVLFELEGSGPLLTLTGYVLEAGRGQRRWARSYRLPSDELRLGVHRMADDIHRELTGVPGFAASRIAFVADHAGQPAIFSVAVDGTELRRLVSGNFPCLFPRYAPSRNWLVYTAYRRGFPELFLVDVGSGKNHSLSSRPGLNSFGAVSPDGRHIAATLSFCGNPEIYLLSITGKVKQRLTHDRACDLSPDWSPDGRRLVYVNDSSGGPQLYVRAADGTGSPRRLTWPFSSSAYCVEPRWSPQGEQIAFCARRQGGYDVLVTSVDGRDVREVTVGGPDETSPDWAADDRHLVVAVQAGRRTGLTIVDVEDTTHRISIPLPPDMTRVRNPTWQRVVH